MNRRAAGSVANPKGVQTRDQWRRSVLLIQGGYYILAGLWPLIHFSSFARFVAVDMNPFQSQLFSALLVVIGAVLIEGARRQPPGPYPTLLGAAAAGAIALVSLMWLPRFGVASALWADLAVEVAFALILILLYPRQQPERRGRVTGRR